MTIVVCIYSHQSVTITPWSRIVMVTLDLIVRERPIAITTTTPTLAILTPMRIIILIATMIPLEFLTNQWTTELVLFVTPVLICVMPSFVVLLGFCPIEEIFIRLRPVDVLVAPLYGFVHITTVSL